MAIKFLDEEEQSSSSTIKFTDTPTKPSIVFTDTAPSVTAASKPPVTAKPVASWEADAQALMEATASGPETAKPPSFDYKELYTNPDLFKIVQDYTKDSTGKEYKDGQDKEQFVAGFMSNLRGQEWNTFSNIAALNKLKNAPMSDREKLAAGTRLFDQVKSATEKGGQPGMAPYADIAKSALTDLTNYLGFGVAAVGKKMIAKEATKAATASLLRATPAAVTASTMGTEAIVGVGQNVIEQKKQQAVSKEPIDLPF
jgi:hypothetical protein